MVLLPPFDRRPGSGSAAVLLSSWRLSERRQPWASPRRTGWFWPVFPGSAIKWPVVRPDRRASALHDGSRPGPWGGGLKGPACLCSSRPDRLARARPFRRVPCGGPPGPSRHVIGGATGTRCGAPGLPGPFSARLGWLRLTGGERGSLPAPAGGPAGL